MLFLDFVLSSFEVNVIFEVDVIFCNFVFLYFLYFYLLSP